MRTITTSLYKQILFSVCICSFQGMFQALWYEIWCLALALVTQAVKQVLHSWDGLKQNALVVDGRPMKSCKAQQPIHWYFFFKLLLIWLQSKGNTYVCIYIYILIYIYVIYILVLYIYYHCMVCMYIYILWCIYIYIDSNKGCKYNQQSENVTVIHHMARIHTCPMTPMRLGSKSVGCHKHSFSFSAWCIPDPRLGLLRILLAFWINHHWDFWFLGCLDGSKPIILYTYFGVEHTCSSDVKTRNHALALTCSTFIHPHVVVDCSAILRLLSHEAVVFLFPVEVCLSSFYLGFCKHPQTI
jgi:hypothetical protein